MLFQGHDKDISVIQVSRSGKYIASGQQTHMGFQVSEYSNCALRLQNLNFTPLI